MVYNNKNYTPEPHVTIDEMLVSFLEDVLLECKYPVSLLNMVKSADSRFLKTLYMYNAEVYIRKRHQHTNQLMRIPNETS